MSRAKVNATRTAKPSRQLWKRCLSVGVLAALILAGYEAWDGIDAMRFDPVATSDSAAGYSNFFPKTSSRSLGYSTGPDDKAYLKLPGVPDSPRRAP